MDDHDDGGASGGGNLAPVQFVSVFHNSEADGDDGVATPVGFQDTPDQWYSSRQKKRGAGNTLADAPTQRESQATQPQSMATEVQSFVPQDGAALKSSYGPSFVNATGSLSSDGWVGDERAEDDVDEDETQIMMSLSQDREAMSASKRRIEEEELASSSSRPDQQPNASTDGNNSDADSDMSDDMLEQDGDTNGLSAIAKNFQQSELNEQSAALEKKASMNVYKPRGGPYQVTPPASVLGGDSLDDSSGAETEVEEEPETTPTSGASRVELPPQVSAAPPRVLAVSVKRQSPLRLAKRSLSENNVIQSTDTTKKPIRKLSLERSASFDDAESSPERARRPRVSLGKTTDGKPPLSRPARSRLDSVDNSTKDTQAAVEAVVAIPVETPSPVNSASHDVAMADTAPQEVEAPAMEVQERPVESPPVEEKTSPPATKPDTPKKTTPKSARKRKRLVQQASVDDVDDDEMDEQDDVVPAVASSAPSHVVHPSSSPSIRIMFTGLDGTIAKLRAKVLKIADASQEDDAIEHVTHLIAPKNQLKRTVKLLCGISCCDHILDERWLDESARSGVGASETMHCLKDTAAEAKWNFSLYHTMYQVPKQKRRALFAGLRFFITNHKSVLPPVKELVKIVECAGGQAETKGCADGDHIVITSETALALAGTKKALAKANPDRINTSELILSSILQQKIDYEAHRLALPVDAATPNKKKRAKR